MLWLTVTGTFPTKFQSQQIHLSLNTVSTSICRSSHCSHAIHIHQPTADYTWQHYFWVIYHFVPSRIPFVCERTRVSTISGCPSKKTMQFQMPTTIIILCIRSFCLWNICDICDFVSCQQIGPDISFSWSIADPFSFKLSDTRSLYHLDRRCRRFEHIWLNLFSVCVGCKSNDIKCRQRRRWPWKSCLPCRGSK